MGQRSLLICLQVDNNASVRQYQEAILVGLLLRHPELVEEYLLPVLAAYKHRSLAVPLSSISYTAIARCLKELQHVYIMDTAPVLTAILKYPGYGA